MCVCVFCRASQTLLVVAADAIHSGVEPVAVLEEWHAIVKCAPPWYRIRCCPASVGCMCFFAMSMLAFRHTALRRAMQSMAVYILCFVR